MSPETVTVRPALLASSVDRISQWELPLCRACHRLGTVRVTAFFSAISRIGDGHYYYVVLGLLLLAQGAAALPLVGHVALVGAAGHLAYRTLKRRTARVRPLHFADGFHLSVPPLDRYSFPSGHTLHAVVFTLVVVSYLPALAWLLVPFTVLVALSRVILGLHYPTDVAAGAGLGALLAQVSFSIL